MPAWCRSRTSSPASKRGPIRPRRARRNASAPAASITTSTMSATPRGTIPSSKCSAISRSATISRTGRSSWPGGCSPRSSGFRPDRLTATVYHTDDEAFELWKKIAGLPESRIIRIPTKDNFWSMGDNGPCGPCSEIFYDHGDHIPGGPPGKPGRGRRPLRRDLEPGLHAVRAGGQGDRPRAAEAVIDTGMGLERVAAVLQGVHDDYDTDTFKALIAASAELTGTNAADADGQPPRHRRPSARVGLPGRRRRAAGQRGAGLCASADHAPRDAPCASARRQRAADAPARAGARRRDGRGLSRAGPRPAADRGDAEAGGDPLPPDAGERPEAARRGDGGR